MQNSIKASSQFNCAEEDSFFDNINKKKDDLFFTHIVHLEGVTHGRSSRAIARISGRAILEHAEELLEKLSENSSAKYSVTEALSVREYLDTMCRAMGIYSSRLGFYDVINDSDSFSVSKRNLLDDKYNEIAILDLFSKVEKECVSKLEDKIDPDCFEEYSEIYRGESNPYEMEKCYSFE